MNTVSQSDYHLAVVDRATVPGITVQLEERCGQWRVPAAPGSGRRHKAGTDQPMGQEICNPHRVVHVGLATWHRLDALCIRDKVSSKSSSSRCHTGFQYTPVASIAICFTSHPVSQAFSSSNEHVVVSKVFTSLCTGSLTQRMHATTERRSFIVVPGRGKSSDPTRDCHHRDTPASDSR